MNESSHSARRFEGTQAPSPRDAYIADIGAMVVRFQDGTAAFDDVAAQILALDGRDLPCMTLLLFGGPVSIDALTAALAQRRSAVIATLDRLQLAATLGVGLAAIRYPSS